MDYNKSKEALDIVSAALEQGVAKFTDAQLKKYSSNIIASREIISVAYSIQGILEGFNTLKSGLDASLLSEDADAFDKYVSDINALLINIDFSNLSFRVNRRKKWLKIVSDLRAVVVKNLDLMRATRDCGAKHAKYMRMSPKQREAAKKASVRQKLAWGM